MRNGENGFLADTTPEWVTALGRLLADPSLRQQMGAEGRRRVEADYCIQKTGPRLAQLLKTVCERTKQAPSEATV